MAQSSWSADSFTWTNSGNVWANTTYIDTATLASNVTQTDTGLTVYPSSATLAATSTLTAAGGFYLIGEALFALNSTASSSKDLQVSVINY